MHLLLLLAAPLVLTGTNPIQATLVDVEEGGLFTVKTDDGVVPIHLLGVECGPVKASDKCIRSGDAKCHDEAVLGRRAAARVRELLSGQSLLVTPCMTFEADKKKRTWAWIQFGNEQDLTSSLSQERLCKRLATACTKPGR